MEKKLKWCSQLTVIRHGLSLYNQSKIKKMQDKVYGEFTSMFEKDPFGSETQIRARLLHSKYRLSVSDRDTPLVNKGKEQAYNTGVALWTQVCKSIPDVIIYSPYLRTRQTLEQIQYAWKELNDVKVYFDERVREKDHG